MPRTLSDLVRLPGLPTIVFHRDVGQKPKSGTLTSQFVTPFWALVTTKSTLVNWRNLRLRKFAIYFTNYNNIPITTVPMDFPHSYDSGGAAVTCAWYILFLLFLSTNRRNFFYASLPPSDGGVSPIILNIRIVHFIFFVNTWRGLMIFKKIWDTNNIFGLYQHSRKMSIFFFG
jgi:hypothetical protein